MLTGKDIRAALTDLINNKAGIPYDVYFNHVNKSDTSYVWVNMSRRKRSWDEVYFQRIIDIDIQVILFPDDYANVKHTDLWDIADNLTQAIMPCIKIKDRLITVQDFNSSIVDDVLHYEFSLDFTDYVQSDKYEGKDYELMMILELNLNDEDV